MKPYEEYADKIIREVDRLEDQLGGLSRRELRQIIIDAWFAGLEHSLVLMEKK